MAARAQKIEGTENLSAVEDAAVEPSQQAAVQVGESYAVVSERISLPVAKDADGSRPTAVKVGDREVPVVNGHIVLVKGEVFAAATTAELLTYRNLAGVGCIRPASAAPAEAI